jgi:hypothetical protein
MNALAQKVTANFMLNYIIRKAVDNLAITRSINSADKTIYVHRAVTAATSIKKEA